MNRSNMKSITVLIVDDDSTTRRIAKAICTSLGHRVYVANDGVEAVRIYEEQRPDIVFMDLQMPQMGGLEAAFEIRQQEAELGLHDTPIVAVSGTVTSASYMQCMQAGINRCMSKPYALEMMQEQIAQFVFNVATDVQIHQSGAAL